MKLYGIMVVQNEGDVIEECLEFLRNLNIYECIFFYDLGSTDDTFIKAQRYKDILFRPKILNQVYTSQLRFDLLKQHKNCYKKGDWLAIIDADEFYYENPIDLIQFAENENATCIKTYQAQFMFTDIDLINIDKEDHTLPVYQRMKYYLVNWSEERFYKFLPGNGLLSNLKPCSKRLLNRHYQYRSPQQIVVRINTRLENRKKTRNIQKWPQVFSKNWKDYVTRHNLLNQYRGGDFTFGIPEDCDWLDYYSKDPFSSISPQIAQALMKERIYTERIILSQENIFKEGKWDLGDYEITTGSVTFQNRYSQYVFRALKDHILASKWKRAIRGVLVLTRYNFHVLVTRSYLKTYYSFIRIKDIFGNLKIILKRIVLGKSIGSIKAHPNPIYVSQDSEPGATTLTWSSYGTPSVEVHLGTPKGLLLSRHSPSGRYETTKCVHDGLVFYLQDVSGGLPLTSSNTLAKVTINVSRDNRITI